MSAYKIGVMSTAVSEALTAMIEFRGGADDVQRGWTGDYLEIFDEDHGVGVIEDCSNFWCLTDNREQAEIVMALRGEVEAEQEKRGWLTSWQ